MATNTSLSLEMEQLARHTKKAARSIARANREQKDHFLLQVAKRIKEQKDGLLYANETDISQAKKDGIQGALLDRLRLSEDRLNSLSKSVEEIAFLEDPVGQIESGWRRPNGILVSRRRIPLGVILLIYEARPNVTIDAATLCIKAGNAVLLRGGSESFHSNRALARILSMSLVDANLDPKAIQYVDTTDRNAIYELLARPREIDLCIPRGGETLVRTVYEKAQMPVLAHERGVCHAYVDQSASLEMALQIVENGKVQRPGVCNALETILVHSSIAEQFLPALATRIPQVEFHADQTASQYLPNAKLAIEDDWYAEYLDLILAVRVVSSLDEAMEHIETFGSRHTETIVTQNHTNAERFLAEVGSSTVLVNASTRLADGGALGLGAEIGISNTRLHAFGPMGLRELTTTKFVVHGSGQLR